jgi:aryl-phospho-beta-D-glucosidase BglC (GH1 family)
MRYLRPILAVALLAASTLKCPAAEPSAQQWLPASPEKLPRWRGFNLLDKFLLGGGRRPFSEDDFRMIAKLGFNFVRLPMDYRFWIKDGDWEQFDEATLVEIDQAVAWGEKYCVHVMVNFHRAPGYTVASPPEPTSLWSDARTQRVCAKHWAMFARRYRGILSTRLSFDLMNEPGNVEPRAYAAVVRQLVEAIRREDPQRLIVADGLQWGNSPVPELRDLHIAQATRGYTPMEISHYKASWVSGGQFPYPHWPRVIAPNGVLLSPAKPEGSYPLVIEGPFAHRTALRLHVVTVSSSAHLVVEAGDKPFFDKQFQCGAGSGEWKRADYKPQWQVYQNLFDRDYTCSIPAGTPRVQIRVTEGDWLELGQIGLKPSSAEKETVVELSQQFGKRPAPFRFAPDMPGGPILGLPMQDRAWLWKQCVEPWKALENQGVGVMVGEWGVFNRTPHDVVLRWAEDCLANWKKAGWGWAMWNFRGSMGVMDSGRTDIRYEDFEGHKLDRKLMDLLQRY